MGESEQEAQRGQPPRGGRAHQNHVQWRQRSQRGAGQRTKQWHHFQQLGMRYLTDVWTNQTESTLTKRQTNNENCSATSPNESILATTRLTAVSDNVSSTASERSFGEPASTCKRNQARAGKAVTLEAAVPLGAGCPRLNGSPWHERLPRQSPSSPTASAPARNPDSRGRHWAN